LADAIALGIKHKRAEQELLASEERFELAVRGSNDGLWDWNVLTDEVYYSPRFKDLLGYQDHEVANRLASFKDLVHPEDLDPTWQALTAHLERQAPFDMEVRLRTKGGDYRWFYARGLAIWDENGRATRMAGSITDITPRKQAAQELRQAKEAAEIANR